MSFELRHDESLRKGIRRIVGKQLDGARESLSDSNRSSLDERIHSVRKRFKRVRTPWSDVSAMRSATLRTRWKMRRSATPAAHSLKFVTPKSCWKPLKN